MILVITFLKLRLLFFRQQITKNNILQKYLIFRHFKILLLEMFKKEKDLLRNKLIKRGVMIHG